MNLCYIAFEFGVPLQFYSFKTKYLLLKCLKHFSIVHIFHSLQTVCHPTLADLRLLYTYTASVSLPRAVSILVIVLYFPWKNHAESFP